MLTITDGGSLSRALSLPIDLRLKQLLIDRRDQLGGRIEDEARFIVVQPGDSLVALEQELGFSVFQNLVDGSRFGDPEFQPCMEWIAYHGHCFELVFILCDSGPVQVVIVQDSPMQNRLLRTFCLTYAEGATS